MIVEAALLSFVATILFVFILRPVAKELGLVDVPGGRKHHGVEVPLIGGISMCVAIGLAATLLDSLPQFFVPLLLAIYLLVLVGTIDDRFELPASVRLVAQTVAAMLVVFGGGVEVASLEQAFVAAIQLGPLTLPFTLLFIVTMINAFNVVDGIDGLAGGLSLVSLAALAVLGFGGDVVGLLVVAGAAVLGFLLFNLPLGGWNRSIRTFMGDSGSTFLGLLIATIGIEISQNSAFSVSPVVGLWLVAVPVYDIFCAAVRRVADGRSPFDSDRSHFHHALMQGGLGPRSTLIFIVGSAAVFAALGLVGHFAGIHDGYMLLGWFLGLALYCQAIRRPAMIVRTMHALRQVRALHRA